MIEKSLLNDLKIKKITDKVDNKEANIYNIFGHTIVKNVIIEDSYAMIDTGACLSKDGYYERLTALHYPSFKMISIV